MTSSAGSIDRLRRHSDDEGGKDSKKPTVLESHGYHLGKPIGSGTFSTVRLATSEKHKGTVAIKIVRKYSAPADFLVKFLPREIEVIKKLHHPNLIRFLQAIETTHRVYIIMEFAERGSVLDAIRSEGHIEENKARKWFDQLVEVIHYCHERGVVHRDIKCENLLLDRHCNVKITDFGFAKEHNRKGEPPLSETYCGSYAYASPEILLGIPYQPTFADVWSMGVVLFGMVYGRLPFDDSVHKKLIKQVMGKVTFPHHPAISAKCKLFISKMLSPLRSRIPVREMKSDPWFTRATSDIVDSKTATENDKAKLIAVVGNNTSVLLKDLPFTTGYLHRDIMEEERRMSMRLPQDHMPATLITKAKKTDPKLAEHRTNRLDSAIEETPVRVFMLGNLTDNAIEVKDAGNMGIGSVSVSEKSRSQSEKSKAQREATVHKEKSKDVKSK